MNEEFPLVQYTNKKTEVLTVTEILHRGNFDPKLSVSRIGLDGKNEKTRNPNNGSLYIIVAGEGEFKIWEEGQKQPKTIKVKPGNSVFIGKGTWYQDSGKMTLYSICSPAFDPESVERAKE